MDEPHRKGQKTGETGWHRSGLEELTRSKVFENTNDADRTERARLFLRSLLRDGLDEFDQLVDHVISACRCACGRRAIRQKKSGKFDFGTDRCSDVADECGVAIFLSSRQKAVTKIREHLAKTDDDSKSDEIRKTEQFLKETEDDETGIEQGDPCLTVGDYLIAIESDGIPAMYTMNGRESQHFCRALGQAMIVRKPNPEHDDVVCSNTDVAWPNF